MRKYLTAYLAYAERILAEKDPEKISALKEEHLKQIAFMQHERIVHFLVTMLFALVLTVFMAVILFKPNIPVIILVTMILVLLAFYIKHYYFLENTVQKMYKVYDGILEKQKKLKESSQ